MFINSLIRKGLATVAASFTVFLVACSSDTVEQSSEAFSTMADVHNNPEIIASTAKIDELLIAQDPDGNWLASVFESDTTLLERGVDATPDGRSGCGDFDCNGRPNGFLWRLARSHRIFLRRVCNGDPGNPLRRLSVRQR